MRIISWNTNGLRATIKQGNFETLFSKYKADIVCFQETKCEPEQIPDEYLNYKNYHSYFAYSKGRKGYSGVAIYSKIKPEKVEYGMESYLPKNQVQKFGDEGRIVVAYYKDFILINCYFPNGGSGPERLKYKLEFYNAFLKFINKLRKENNIPNDKTTKRQRNIIFCGDINTAHKAIDLARPKANENNTGFLPIERAWIDKVVSNNWFDAFRYFYPEKKDVYTYWDQKTASRDRNVGWRIDYFFIDQLLINKIKKFYTLSDYYGSDHCPIMIET